MLLQSLLLVFSLALLYFGAEFALEASERIGRILKLSPLVIGVVLIGFGTSLPEFFVSQISSFKGHPEMAIGNILGSNIANIFLILGVSSLITTLHLNKKAIQNQLVVHIFLSLTLGFIIYRQKIDYISMLILGIFFIFSLYKTFSDLKKHGEEIEEQENESISIKNIGELFIGFLLLYFGGDLLVSSGSKLAEGMGVSEYLISVIFVAFGTSFPELITALVACKKKKDVDLITGNIIGSNIFNVAFVLGSLGVYNFPLKEKYILELSTLIIISLILFALSFWPKKLNRLIGTLFLGVYVSLIYYWF